MEHDGPEQNSTAREQLKADVDAARSILGGDTVPLKNLENALEALKLLLRIRQNGVLEQCDDVATRDHAGFSSNAALYEFCAQNDTSESFFHSAIELLHNAQYEQQEIEDAFIALFSSIPDRKLHSRNVQKVFAQRLAEGLEAVFSREG